MHVVQWKLWSYGQTNGDHCRAETNPALPYLKSCLCFSFLLLFEVKILLQTSTHSCPCVISFGASPVHLSLLTFQVLSDEYFKSWYSYLRNLWRNVKISEDKRGSNLFRSVYIQTGTREKVRASERSWYYICEIDNYKV